MSENTTTRWPRPTRNEQNKANSLVHLELARRTKSIVITFNYRIGLLGYLPYVDMVDRQPGSGGGLLQGSNTRSNHALWDQIGLLHWIRHNVAHFGGDQTNVSLLSGDAGAIQTIQLLALSPQAKGLFKRLILIHDDEDDNAQVHPTPDEHFSRLLGLAQKSRHLRKKLISELGLILEREDFSKAANSQRSNGEPDNLEVDRRVSEFLKSAQLEQLARVEHELAKVSVAHHHQIRPPLAGGSKQKLSSTTASTTTTTRLIDVIREPNLDDKLLFPYFSHLIKTNQSLELVTRDSAQVGQSPPSVGFWSSLATSIDEQQSGNISMSLETVQLESDYCCYMHQLYAQMFAHRPDSEMDSAPLASELKRIDPYKLIPRVSDHQLMMMSAAMITTNPAVIRSETSGGSGHGGGGGGTSPNDKDAQLQQQQTSTKHLIKWRQRNLTANALEFYHLRHAHLLQQLLVQKLDQLRKIDDQPTSDRTRYQNSTLLDGGQHRDINELEDDDDDGEADNLVTRMQRQQQRSIMMMQQQQYGNQDSSGGFSRNKRDSVDGQTADFSQQMIELLGSFDLLIGFAGDPLETRSTTVGEPESEPALVSAIKQLALRNTTLSAALLSYLQMADLHHVASIKSKPRHMGQLQQHLCEFTAAGNRRQSSADWWRESARFEGVRSSFVLVANQRRRRLSDEQENIIENERHSLENEFLLEKIAEFASTGKLSGGDQSRDSKGLGDKRQKLVPYNTLDRQIDWTGPTNLANNSDKERTLIKDLINVHLNLVPYLKRILQVSSSRHSNNGLATTAKHERLLEHPLMPSVDMISCLSELNSILTSPEAGREASHLYENSTLVRFYEESPCLLNATNKLRLQLRVGAAEELDPLIRQYFIINEQRQKHQQQNQTTATRKEGESGGGQQETGEQQQASLQADQKQPHQRVSSMTTRNLVNQSEGLYLDQLSSSGSSSSVVDQIGHHLERELADGSNGEHQRIDLGQSGIKIINSQGGGGGGNGGGIRGFFAKTYKDAVGQALGIVVGTGLLIFLLNLVIVLVIAFRSRRNLRRAGGSGHMRQAVQDSSMASPPSPMHDIEGNQEQLTTLNGAELVTCQHHYGQLSQPMMNGSFDMRGQQQQTDDQARHLISSFKNCNNQQQPMQARSSLSSNSQRANKSIKFDLSGEASDKTSLAKLSLGQSQRSIMKQPATTSDEDELQLTGAGGGCAHHYHLYHLDNHQPAGQGRKQRETDPYSMAAISTTSLDVLDLIPLEGHDGYDAHELVISSGDDYLEGRQQLVAAWSVTGKCQPHQQHPSNQQQHYHHQQQHINHHHHQQSLGSSSLTSPFASQSTHSTISVSINGHMQNVNNLNGSDFSPKQSQLPQQQQPYTFNVGSGIGALNSPTSSTTLSSMPTPILLTHQHYGTGSQKSAMVTKSQDQTGSLAHPLEQEVPLQTGNQLIGLIYGGDGSIGQGRASGTTLNGAPLGDGNLIMLPAHKQAVLEQQQQKWSRQQHSEN